MNQVFVLVKEKSGDQRTLTYKSFLDLQDRFELIGQSTEDGTLIPGDPNLNPRHQKVAVQDVVVPAVNVGIVTGMTMEEKLAKREELIKQFTQPEPPTQEVKEEPKEEVKPKRKPGPKPKVTA